MPIRKNKISYKVDLKEKLKNVAPGKRKKAAEAYAEAVRDKMFDFMNNEKSPVSGIYRKFKPLSDEYKQEKASRGAGIKADLSLTNAMRESIKIRAKKDSFELKITDSLQKKKFYNHNVGDTVPKRTSMPDDDGKFKRQVLQAGERALRKYIDPERARKKDGEV